MDNAIAKLEWVEIFEKLQKDLRDERYKIAYESREVAI